jgi:stage V sporulation protein SpoVS
MMETIEVVSGSRVTAVAREIEQIIREHQRAEVMAVGARAVNRAVKALVLANDHLQRAGILLNCVPEYREVATSHGEETAVKLVIEPNPQVSLAAMQTISPS